MKKGYKIFFSLCAVFILAFSIFLGDFQTLFVSAGSVQSNEIIEYNSFDSNDYISCDVVGTGLDVSFIAPDNTILYSTGNYISSGSSLQDIENSNIALNSAFINNTNNQSSYTGVARSICVDNWMQVVPRTTVTTKSGSVDNSLGGIIFTETTSGANNWLIQSFSDLSSFAGQTLTFTCSISDISFSTGNYVVFGVYNSNNNYGIDYRFESLRIYSSGIYSITMTFPNSFTYSYLNFTFVLPNNDLNSSITIDWVKSEFNSNFTGYFNSTLLNNKLSEYNFSNYYYQYDIDTTSVITSDKYYYPVKFNYINFTWTPKTWNGFYNINGANVWTDGTYYYYSEDSYQYVLDISTFTWSQKIWNGLTNFNGANVWTDGTYYYYSSGNVQYVLDISTYTWTPKIWNGLTNFTGSYVWTDGNYVYYSLGSNQKVLSGSTWSDKTWNGLTNFSGSYVWTDGVNFYYSSSLTQKVLSGSTWSDKTWNGLGISGFSGYNVWSDGVNFYSSNGTLHYLIDLSSSSLIRITWSGPASFYGDAIFVVDNVCYYSFYGYQYTFTYLSASDIGYNTGFNDGYNTAYNTAYNKGYNLGVENAGNYTFFSLISAVIDAPIKTLTGLFNFELLGVNLFNLFTGLLTLAVLLFVIRLVLGGK